MGRIYKLECSGCKTQFMHTTDSGFGVLLRCVGCGDEAPRDNVAKAVTCPGCHRKMNDSCEEFMQQVLEEMVWD